ncbi:MAG: M23 family metallopeptidase, partial [Eubacteriales bacterium]
MTSPRGWRTLNGTQDYHKGIDLVGVDDTTVYSVSDGVVRTAYQANGAGNYVVVTMSDGRRVFYMHLASFKVKTGDTVKTGQALGVMGNTGYSFGAHTHLELRPAGTTGDSLDICEFTGIPNKVGTYTYKEETNMANRFTDISGSIAEKEIEQL